MAVGVEAREVVRDLVNVETPGLCDVEGIFGSEIDVDVVVDEDEARKREMNLKKDGRSKSQLKTRILKSLE